MIRHGIAKFDPQLSIFWSLGLLHLDLYSNFLSSFLKILHVEVVDNFGSLENVRVDRIGLFCNFRFTRVILSVDRADFSSKACVLYRGAISL